MSEDNRKYKRIVRVDDAADARIRAYASAHSITVSEACIALVMGSWEKVTTAPEVRSVDPAPAVPEPSAPSPALPEDLTEAIAQRAAAKGTTADETIAAVLRVGLKRLEAVDRYASKK